MINIVHSGVWRVFLIDLDRTHETNKTATPVTAAFIEAYPARILLSDDKGASASRGNGFAVNERERTRAFVYILTARKIDHCGRLWTVRRVMVNFYGCLYFPRALVRLVKFAC